VRRVTLASTGQGLGGAGVGIEDDALIAWSAREAVPANWRNRVHLVSEYLRPDEYARLAGQHTATLSMRMHGVILATTAGSPVLLANASDKASALAARTGGGIRAIADREDLGRLDELMAPILEAPGEVLVGQNEAVEQMRALARKNAALVAGALG
jgi:polysaccharide pyruvyl transferase WcaK-like protein